MEIIHYLEPAKKTWIQYPGIAPEEALGTRINFFNGEVDWFLNVKMKVAVVGIPENRNATHHMTERAPDGVRMWLYGMRNTSANIEIADVGNVRGKNLNDRYQASREVIDWFTRQQILVLLIGGSQDLTWPACGFLKNYENKSNIAIVDAFLDVDVDGVDFSSSAYINKLVDDMDDKIEEIAILGTQVYYCSRDQENYLKKHFFPVKRLKDLRGDNISYAEVVLRDAMVMSFDFNALENQPGLPHDGVMPNGFSNAEACRIFWYAGASDIMKVAGIFNMNFDDNVEKINGPLAAQILWHFFEGIGARAGDYPVCSIEEYEYKVVYLEAYDENLSFYHNPENDRWWIVVPGISGKRIVACHPEDYKQALKMELPEIWWGHFHKTNANFENNGD